jgi:uncharacterized protein YaiE (UPF0345 family)
VRAEVEAAGADHLGREGAVAEAVVIPVVPGGGLTAVATVAAGAHTAGEAAVIEATAVAGAIEVALVAAVTVVTQAGGVTSTTAGAEEQTLFVLA